jgi:hypothetical protein
MATERFETQLQEMLTTLQQQLQNVDLEAVSKRTRSQGSEVALNSAGTAGTYGTLSGCFGTLGSFGSLSATDVAE